MRFLIIDDDVTECLLTHQALSDKFPDADIIEVSSQQIYAEILPNAQFDLVITEYRLNWTDGLKVFKDVRLLYPTLPVIMVTSYGNETIAVEAIKKGLSDYIVKSNRAALCQAIMQSLPKYIDKQLDKNEETDVLLCEKWDLAISKLTSDFAYSMRISPEGETLFEWITEPFKKFLDNHAETHSQPNKVIHNFGLTIHPDDEVTVQNRFSKLLAGYEDTAEYRIISKQGEIRCLSDHALPIRDWTSGKVVRIYGAIQDVTWRRNAEDKLRLMQRAIDSSNNGIVITDLADTDYAIIYANNAFLNLTGYSMHELLGQNCRILQKAERDQPEIENLRIALNQDMDGYAILRNYRKDGSQFWNEIYISPVRDSQNKITHYLGVQNDVTQRYEMEVLLVKNEAKMRAIFENVSDGIIIINEYGFIESVNPSAEKMFGYSADEIISKHINILMPEPNKSFDSSCLSSYWLNCRDDALAGRREFHALNKDGSLFPIALGVSEINLEQRRLFVSTIHDLSESKRVEAVLRTSEQRYRTLFENAVEAIFVNRGGNKIEQVNQACLRLWRAETADELLGRNPLEIFHPDYHAQINERIKGMSENKLVAPFIEEKIIRLDGSIADVLVSAIPFEDEQGPLIFVILLDITERKLAEETLRKSKRNYRKLSNHMDLVREEERKRIAREIHDEVGSFLTALKMDLSWLANHLPAHLKLYRKKTLAMTQQIDESIQTVKRIITDLRPSILDHLGLLSAIEWLVYNFRQRTNLHCVLTAPDKDLIVEANRSTAIFRIIQETLNNIHIHAHASQVSVVIEAIDNNLIATLHDNGCGITLAQQNQSDSFGIQGMRERARHFNGELTITGRPGTGTTVRLCIPLHPTNSDKPDD